MAKNPFKNLKFCRYFSYWLYVVLSIALPVALIAWQFSLFKKPGPLQITGYGIIALIIVVFIFRSHLKQAINDMEKCITRTIIQNVLRIFPYLLCWVILVFLEQWIIKVRFILLWWIIGYFAAMFVDLWHTNCVLKCKENNQ